MDVMRATEPPLVSHRTRRAAMALAVAGLAGGVRASPKEHVPSSRWYEAALQMQRLAESWGDQSYGAVLVKDASIIGYGPSRVVKDGNADAHAEREAIKDAIARLGGTAPRGAVLYSTARPCAACERAAALAGIARMYFGPALQDAGAPRTGP